MEISKLQALNASLIAALPTLDLKDLAPINGGLTKGFTSKVVSFGYNELNFKRTTPQTITIAGVETIIPVGENTLSLGFAFEDGSQIALSTLIRSAMSSIGGVSARSIKAEDLTSYIGKTFTVADVQKDASTERVNRVQVNGVEVERPNVGKMYNIQVS